MNLDIKCKDDYFNGHYIIKQLEELEIDINNFDNDELKDEWIHQDLFLDFILTLTPDFKIRALNIHEKSGIVTSPLKKMDIVDTEDYIYNITQMLLKNNYPSFLKRKLKKCRRDKYFFEQEY